MYNDFICRCALQCSEPKSNFILLIFIHFNRIKTSGTQPRRSRLNLRSWLQKRSTRQNYPWLNQSPGKLTSTVVICNLPVGHFHPRKVELDYACAVIICSWSDGHLCARPQEWGCWREYPCNELTPVECIPSAVIIFSWWNWPSAVVI